MDAPTDVSVTEEIAAEGIPQSAALVFGAQQAALADLQSQPARLLVVVDLPVPVRDQPVRRVHRQRQAHPRRI